MKKWNIGLAIVFISLTILIFISTAPYHRAHGNDPGPAYWPRAVSVLMSLLSIGMVVEGFVKERKRAESDKPIDLRAPEMKRIYAMILIFIAFAALLYIFGFVIATLLFIPAVMRLLGEDNWLKCAITSVLVTGVVYAAFTLLLRISLPQPIFL